MSVERMCLDGRVRLVFEVGPMPRPNTSHNVAWVRQHAGTQNCVSFISQRPSFRTVQRGRIFVVTITLNVTHLYVAQELTQYPQTVMTAVLQHEQGHVPPWERVMAGNLADIATELGSRISPPDSATGPVVNRIVGSFSRQWAILGRDAADTWDSTDYPRLQRVLRSANVDI